MIPQEELTFEQEARIGQLLKESELLEEHTLRLDSLLKQSNGNGSLLSRLWRGHSTSSAAGRMAIQNESVEINRLLRWVPQMVDHMRLPPDHAHIRPLIGQRIQQAQKVYLQVVEKYPLDRKRAAYVEYLEYLIRYNNHIDPRGVRQIVRLVTLPMEEVYIPLEVERNRPAERTELAPLVARSPYLVILGESGSGKTTLMRFLAYQFARACRTDAPQVQAQNEGREDDYGPTLLPIFFRVASYAEAFHRSKGALSLREFLLQAFAAVPTTPEYLQMVLSEALDSGKALVLLDGLDEVIDSQDRHQIGERILEFVRDHPSIHLIVTSRIAGYAEARLGGPFAANTYTLCPMEPEQVKRFVQCWCPAVERFHHPQATETFLQEQAQTEIEGILRGYDQNEGVRQLAQNPLLLTLLTLVHRAGKPLPEQRDELYHIAVQTLLHDWRPEPTPQAEAIVTEAEEALFLHRLALQMQAEEPTGMMSEARVKPLLLGILAEERHSVPTDPEVKRLVENFLWRVRFYEGVFVENAPGFYGFIHQTFAEYFATPERETGDS